MSNKKNNMNSKNQTNTILKKIIELINDADYLNALRKARWISLLESLNNTELENVLQILTTAKEKKEKIEEDKAKKLKSIDEKLLNRLKKFEEEDIPKEFKKAEEKSVNQDKEKEENLIKTLSQI